jgi:SAM-dependent methyltransferase
MPREHASHISRNRRAWDQMADKYQAEHASQLDVDEPVWGLWDVPESEVRILGDVRGKDVLEFGCGAARWSINLARMGARCTGLDLSGSQLQHARRQSAEAGQRLALVQADAEIPPFRDESFDVVFGDHGAMTFADPHRAVPEVARVLRPGGLFAFNMTTPILWLCWSDDEDEPAGPMLHRDYFSLGRVDWNDSDWQTTDFQLPYGEWIRLFRRNGLAIEDLVELRPAEGATTTYSAAPYDWARRWPSDHIWVTRKE